MCRSNRVRSVRFVGAVGSWRERLGRSRFGTAIVYLLSPTMAKAKSMLAGFDLPEWQESRVS